MSTSGSSCRIRDWGLGATAAVTLLSAAVAAAPSAYAATPQPPKPAPVPGAPTSNSSQTFVLNDATDPDAAAIAAACVPYAIGDNVHVSSSAPEASGHGWWSKGTCADSTATVAVYLQEFFTDGVWRGRGSTGMGTYPPGGGSGNRATARQACLGVVPAGWRSLVVVQTPSGGAASGYTPSQNIPCRDVPD